MRPPRWTPNEDSILRNRYISAPVGKRLATIEKLLPGRTRDAISRRANYIGIAHRRPKPKHPQNFFVACASCEVPLRVKARNKQQCGFCKATDRYGPEYFRRAE